MTPEEKLRTQQEVGRLLKTDDLNALQDMLTILSESLFTIFMEHGKTKSSDQSVNEGKLIAQMVFTKLLNLKKLLTGVDFKSRNGTILPNTVDPTVIAPLVRNLYETVAMFHLVYLSGHSMDEKTVIYKLWVIAGLKYRQRLATKLSSPENQQKQADELKTINNLIAEIHQSALYKNLPLKEQEKLDQMIKKKDYKLSISDNVVAFHSWEDLIGIMNLKPSVAKEMYTYLSLYGHPSNVSVFQFRDLFRSKEHSIKLSMFNVSYAVMLTSIFIGDYLKVFPECQSIFDTFPIQEQVAINMYHLIMKADSVPINNAVDLLL
jgi:hypothetical protein